MERYAGTGGRRLTHGLCRPTNAAALFPGNEPEQTVSAVTGFGRIASSVVLGFEPALGFEGSHTA